MRVPRLTHEHEKLDGGGHELPDGIDDLGPTGDTSKGEHQRV